MNKVRARDIHTDRCICMSRKETDWLGLEKKSRICTTIPDESFERSNCSNNVEDENRCEDLIYREHEQLCAMEERHP